jgi:hypothetical protein
MCSAQNFLFSSDVALISGQMRMHSATDVTLISSQVCMYSAQNFLFSSDAALISAQMCMCSATATTTTTTTTVAIKLTTVPSALFSYDFLQLPPSGS